MLDVGQSTCRNYRVKDMATVRQVNYTVYSSAAKELSRVYSCSEFSKSSTSKIEI